MLVARINIFVLKIKLEREIDIMTCIDDDGNSILKCYNAIMMSV